MTSPDILQTLGFQKSKIGSDEKEVGYVIQESKLKLFGGAIVFGSFLMILGVVLFFVDIRVEKRHDHSTLRAEEHQAASKLAKIEMELWSHYREDIEESNEAQQMVKNLNKSYVEFSSSLQDTVKQFANELYLKDDMANAVADRILSLVAELQANNSKKSKHLVQHLVESGRKAVTLEKDAHKKALQEVEAEAAGDKDDERYGTAIHPDAEEEKHNPLTDMLQGFWVTFHDYEEEFSGETRAMLSEPGNPVYQQLKELRDKIISEEGISEEDVMTGLGAIGLSSVGAGLGSGRALPPHDIVEELYLVPKIPHAKLEQLEKDWRSGKKATNAVFKVLAELQAQELIPSGWVQKGVDREEDDDGRDEAQQERKGIGDIKTV